MPPNNEQQHMANIIGQPPAMPTGMTPGIPAPAPSPAPQYPTPPAMPPVDNTVSDIVQVQQQQQQQPAPPAPDNNQPPEWAQQLITGFQNLNQDVTALKQTVTAPPAPAPAPQEQQPFKPNSWDDVLTEAEKIAQAKIEEDRQKREAEQTAAQQAEQEQVAQIDKYLDDQVAYLEAQNILPKVANPNDPNDPGKRARVEMYAYATKLGTTNLVEVAGTLKAVHASGQYFDVNTQQFVQAQAPGFNAPIAGATPVATPSMGAVPSTKVLANASFDQVAEMAKRAYPTE